MLHHRDARAGRGGAVAVGVRGNRLPSAYDHGITGDVQLTRTHLDAGHAGNCAAVDGQRPILRMIDSLCTQAGDLSTMDCNIGAVGIAAVAADCKASGGDPDIVLYDQIRGAIEFCRVCSLGSENRYTDGAICDLADRIVLFNFFQHRSSFQR